MIAPAGLIPVLATPFDERERVDAPSLERLVRWQLDAGADGLAVFGMASEGFALTAADRAEVLRVVTGVVRELHGEAAAVPVIAGIGATSTATAVEQAEHAVRHGADVLMVLPPFMVKPSPAQLPRFFGDVAAATAASVMVQDAPGVTGVAMPVALVVELCGLPGVTSVKVEAPPTAPKVGAVVRGLRAAGSDAVVIGGQNAFFLLEEMAVGAQGTMPACEFTDRLRVVLDRWGAGDRDGARAAYEPLQRLIRLGMQAEVAHAVHKEVLVRRGLIDTATVRLPAGPVDPDSLAAVEETLASLGMLASATAHSRALA